MQTQTVEFLRLCKAAGLNTAVETCGQIAPEVVAAAVPATDLFLWDIKDTDPQRHLRYTGVSGERIRENLRLVDSLGGKTRLRCILVNGVNTDPTHYAKVGELYHSLRHCEGVELLPYHTYGGSKAVALGRPDSGCREWIPTVETVTKAVTFLQEQGISVLR
jgi:pyruvate formate lyase activating enzyme